MWTSIIWTAANFSTALQTAPRFPPPLGFLVSFVETPEFLSATRKLMTEEERAVLVDYLAHNPAVGDLIQGTGGVRKLR